MKTIQVAASLDNFDTLIQFIDECSETAGFDKKQVNKIHLACEEIIVNIIKYAYPESKGMIEVRCEIHKDNWIRITFIDDGVPFNPLLKEEPDIGAPIEERQIGGLGIFIVKKIMGEVIYERKGTKNILVVKKYLKDTEE